MYYLLYFISYLENVRFEKISVQEGSFPVRPKMKWGFGVEQNSLADGQYKELGISFNYGYHLNPKNQFFKIIPSIGIGSTSGLFKTRQRHTRRK